MAFCTVEEIRNENDKLASVTDITDLDIESRIISAERQVKADLGKILTPAEIDDIGADSNVIKTLTIIKTVERTLVKKFGAKRKLEDTTDIEYYKNEYKNLLDKILNGEIPIDIPDTSEATVAKSYPKLSGTRRNKRFYPRKGISGFMEDGVEDDYVDDSE